MLSAWCLGILNSHRRFFLSYAAPVLWNARHHRRARLLRRGGSRASTTWRSIAAWGAVAGSVLQFLVQLPTVLGCSRPLRAVARRRATPVRTVLRNFVPVFVGRGVVQISAYIDTVLASLLPTGAVAALANAQMLYTLPVSLFGMSVVGGRAARRCRARPGDGAARAGYLRTRLDAGLRRIAFFVVPSAVAFLALGDVVTRRAVSGGRVHPETDASTSGRILAGSAVGLLAATLGRLYASTYYALHDTRTPLRFAVVRVALAVRRWASRGARAAAGSSASTAGGAPPASPLAAGIAGWVEFAAAAPRAAPPDRRAPACPPPTWRASGSAAALAAAAGWAVKLAVTPGRPILAGLFSWVPMGSPTLPSLRCPACRKPGVSSPGFAERRPLTRADPRACRRVPPAIRPPVPEDHELPR